MQIKVPIHQLLWEEIKAEPGNSELVDAVLKIVVSRTGGYADLRGPRCALPFVTLAV